VVTLATFQTQLPLSEPTNSSPGAEVDVGVAATMQPAVSPLVGSPQATEVTAAMELAKPGTPVADVQSCGEAVRLPVQMAGFGVGLPGTVPMARQLLAVQESPVTEVDPVGKVASFPQLLLGLAAMVALSSVGSDALVESPVATATHRVVVGQAIWPTELRVDGTSSREKVGIHPEFVANVAGSPSNRKMPGADGGEPALADPPSSQVVVVGQAREDSEVKVVEAGETIAQVSCWGEVWPTAPASSTGPEAVVPIA
jgi:hypothetical protein